MLDYMNIYKDKANIRPSCYRCPYTTMYGCSDLTIGDFWGCDRFYPEYENQLGNSLILVRTYKGKLLFDSVKHDMEYYESNADNCKQNRLSSPVIKPVARDDFWSLYRDRGIKSVLKKYGGFTVMHKIKNKIKLVLNTCGGGVLDPLDFKINLYSLWLVAKPLHFMGGFML